MYADIIKLSNVAYELDDTPSPQDVFGSEFDEDDFSSAVLDRGKIEATLLKYASVVNERLWEPLLEGTSDKDEILDIGSGGAYHLTALDEELRNRVCLMDLCGVMLDDAKARFPKVNAIRRNWLDNQLPSNSVKRISGFNADTMMCNDEDMELFLTECMRVLAPGGRLVFLDIHAPRLVWAKEHGVDDSLPSEIYYHYMYQYREQCIDNFQKSQRDIIRSLGGKPRTYGVGYFDFNTREYGEAKKPIVHLIVDKDR